MRITMQHPNRETGETRADHTHASHQSKRHDFAAISLLVRSRQNRDR